MEWLEEIECAQQRESQGAGRGYGCIHLASFHSLSFPEDARRRRNRRAVILRRAPNRRWGRWFRRWRSADMRARLPSSFYAGKAGGNLNDRFINFWYDIGEGFYSLRRKDGGKSNDPHNQ